MDPTEPLRYSQGTRYRRIFFFEQLEFSKDDVRSENEKNAAKLNVLLREAYLQIGYEIDVVPAMPVKDRTDLVLENCE